MRSRLITIAGLLFLLAPRQATAKLAQTQQPETTPSTSPFADVDRLLQLGKFTEAITRLEAMQMQSPPPKGLARELGIAYYKKNDFVNAIPKMQEALKENPDDGETIQLTGLSLYLGGKPAEAIPYLEKVQTWYPRANVDASVYSGRRVHSDQTICPSKGSLREDVRRAARFARGLSILRAHPSAIGLWASGGRVRAESHLSGPETAFGALSPR